MSDYHYIVHAQRELGLDRLTEENKILQKLLNGQLQGKEEYIGIMCIYHDVKFIASYPEVKEQHNKTSTSGNSSGRASLCTMLEVCRTGKFF